MKGIEPARVSARASTSCANFRASGTEPWLNHPTGMVPNSSIDGVRVRSRYFWCCLAVVTSLMACNGNDGPGTGKVGTPSQAAGAAGTTGGREGSSDGGSSNTASGAPNPALGGVANSGGAAIGGASNGGAVASGGAGAAASTGSGGVTTIGGASSSGATTNGGAAAALGGATNAGAPGEKGGAANTGGTSGGTSGSAGGSSAPPITAAGVRWIGRVDTADAAGPRFAWSGTGFAATVTGTTISVKLRSTGSSDPIFFQPVIDGALKARVSVATSEGEKTVTLATGLSAGDHVVELYRETEGRSNYAYSTFLGFVSGTPQAPPAYSGRLIEVIGDSISAGYGNLGSEQHPNGGDDPAGGCRFTTETESAYMTYGAIAARAVNADASILAASGWGIYSDNGGNTSNVLSALYANTLGGVSAPAWPFQPKPQVVVINLGTNDFSANANLASAPFTTAYNSLLTTVRSKYPYARINFAIGSLLYGTGLANATSYIKALVAARKNQGDNNIKVLEFGQQDASKGTGCDWHPNVAEHQRMAALLTQELKTSLGW